MPWISRFRSMFCKRESFGWTIYIMPILQRIGEIMTGEERAETQLSLKVSLYDDFIVNV